MRKEFDDFYLQTADEDALFDEVSEMEHRSEWIRNVISKEILLEPISSPLAAMDAAIRNGLDRELFMDTAGPNGTKLLIDFGNGLSPVRDTAKGTLSETAKLFGSALGRMSAELLAGTLNNGLSVAKGRSLVLMRYDKVSAVHSDADGGYMEMPMEDLLTIAKERPKQSFGELEFRSGFVTHGLTTALWALPDVQDEILDLYQDALTGAISRFFAVNAMPAIRFSSSDTASSCARLTPVFLGSGGTEYRLVDGISVKHSKRFSLEGESGIDAFRKGAGDLYAMFRASAEVVRQLSHLEIYHPANCVVSLCKRFGIPKKWGEIAREMVENFSAGGKRISAHDVYLAMTMIIPEAKKENASRSLLDNLSESIAKIAACDWSAHDVGGTVAWS